MSAPFLWIIFPAVAAGILYLFRRQERGVIISGVVISALLAWLGWQLPIDKALSLGPWSLELSSIMWILGRRLVLTNSERSFLTLIYLASAFWFGGALAVASPTGSSEGDHTAPGWKNNLFVPVGLGIVSLLVASIAVDPFLYAALFIEIAAFLCIPLLAAPQKAAGRGVLRFLTFQTLGAPFILFSGWITTELQSDPDPAFLALRAALLAGLGFSFLLAVFPFHTWLPMLSDEAHPYMAAFVFYILPGVVFLFALKYLANNIWLFGLSQATELLRLAGAGMVLFGGLSAAFQRRLGRMLAYAVIVEIGFSFIALVLQVNGPAREPGAPLMNTLFFSLFITRSLALGIWALALSVFYVRSPSLHFSDVRGLGRSFPIAASALILAHFAIAGFPLLAGFPARLEMIERLAGSDPVADLWILVGMGGLLVGGLRTLAVLVMGADEAPWAVTENRTVQVFLLAGIAALFFTGFLTY